MLLVLTKIYHFCFISCAVFGFYDHGLSFGQVDFFRPCLIDLWAWVSSKVFWWVNQHRQTTFVL